MKIDKGGWNIFVTAFPGILILNPGIHVGLRGDGAGWPGWPTDPVIEKLRDAWIDAADQAERKRIAVERTLCADRRMVQPNRISPQSCGCEPRAGAHDVECCEELTTSTTEQPVPPAETFHAFLSRRMPFSGRAGAGRRILKMIHPPSRDRAAIGYGLAQPPWGSRQPSVGPVFVR